MAQHLEVLVRKYKDSVTSAASDEQFGQTALSPALQSSSNSDTPTSATSTTSTIDLLYNCLVAIHKNTKNTSSADLLFEEEAKLALVTAFSQLSDFLLHQISHYKDYFPPSTTSTPTTPSSTIVPADALETCILMLRIIHKNPIYREDNGFLSSNGRAAAASNTISSSNSAGGGATGGGSFREMMTGTMKVASVARYQKLQEHCFDSTDGLIEGLFKLAQGISEEIEMDAKHYQSAFSKEFDIVRLTAETYIKYFILTLESNRDIISSDEAVEHASKTVFSLYKKLLSMDRRYGKLVPSLQHLSNSAGFNVEHWFLPFIHKWLDHLSLKTLSWVVAAVKNDSFEAYSSKTAGANSLNHHSNMQQQQMQQHLNNPQLQSDAAGLAVADRHSSSVTDLFTVVYQEFDFLSKLQWTNEVQSAGFAQRFAKIVNLSVEQYCDAVSVGEIKNLDKKETSAWSSLASFTSSSTDLGRSDISMKSCVKLCNILYAVRKLEEFHSMINAETMSKMLHEYRATLRRPPARGGSMKFSRSSSFTSAMTVNSHSSSFESKSTTMIAGQAKIEIVNAENLKPCNKNGLANPYVVVKVPEGTQVLSSMDDESIPVIHHQNQATSSSAAAVVSSPILSSASSTVSSNNNNTSTAFNSTTNNGRPSSIKSSVSDKSNGNNNNNNTSSSSSSAATPSTTVLSGKDCELARSRIEYDSLNVSWDESFHCILPAVDKLDILIYSKNMISADEQMGRAEIDFAQLSALSSSSSATTSVVSRSNSDAGVGGLAKTMRAVNLHDHQTHDIWIDVEPQGRLLLRLTLEGEDEDVDFWFKKSIERLGRTRDDFYRVLTAKIAPYAKKVLNQAIKENDAAPLPSKSIFSSLTEAVVYSNITSTGISIDAPFNADEADIALAPLTDHLNKNLAILCLSLPPDVAHQVVKRTWDDMLLGIESLLVPPLYGQIEKDRRLLNKRQLSIVDWALLILKEFFHAEGQEMGLPLRLLETPKYLELTALVSHIYHGEISRLRREYEMSILGGRWNKEKRYILRLIRLRAEKTEDADQAAALKLWFDNQLVSRKEKL